MKKQYTWFIIIIFSLILPLSVIGTAAAKTMYVSDMLHASIRTGPSTENKIIAFAKSNRSVAVLEQSEDWSYIKLSNGKEGWMLSRLLIAGPTKDKIIKQLNTENNKFKKECSFLSEENTRLKAESIEQQSKIKEQEKTLFTLKQKTDDLSHNRPIRWVLSGAFILLTGIFIGYSSRKKQRGMFTD